ncbi:adenine nucleotide alpha hydrolase [Aureibaculum marinum]|uniref:Adenine nucleotide alpha hydrolase n=1 Tax=Aureibaculum marinum TaxID=2487930 RepID=A0A3N4P4D1_9FLAO|nr:adenine nucleotide alpha hydrolase [Aureibaculum marinum]RPD94283.1 adenine nucleotide alpha hydrolase [Aureibaculum marinum]
MPKRKKAVFNWSGGKDSALALQKTLEENKFEIVSLLTTISEEKLKSSIHDIPLKLLLKQAESIGIPLYTVLLSKDNKTYKKGMSEAITHFKNLGVTHFIFGDIFLEDVKLYRENILYPLEMEIVEPLWGKTSEEVMNDFLKTGIKTKIVVTQADKLDQTFIGKEIDKDFAKSLPKGVDLCGENGEYHTFSYDGGPFKNSINFNISKPNLISYKFKLENGQIIDASYWRAELLA